MKLVLLMNICLLFVLNIPLCHEYDGVFNSINSSFWFLADLSLLNFCYN